MKEWFGVSFMRRIQIIKQIGKKNIKFFVKIVKKEMRKSAKKFCPGNIEHILSIILFII